jgi:hypothetical protein
LTERVDDATHKFVAYGHGNDPPGPFDRIAFLDFSRMAEQNGADAFLFEVERDAEQAIGELQHLSSHRTLDAMYAGDAIADRYHGAHFGHVDIDGVVANVVADDLGNFFGLNLHCCPHRQARRLAPFEIWPGASRAPPTA